MEKWGPQFLGKVLRKELHLPKFSMENWAGAISVDGSLHSLV